MRRNSDTVHACLMELGASMGCHQMAERSFFLGRYQFPLCARCTGVLLGYIAGIALLFFHLLNPITCCCALAVMYADWKVQDLGICESTNLRRLLTGTLCGAGYIHLMAKGVLLVSRLIQHGA